ncbi:MAG: hypothetical protein ACKVZJ_00960 [Phycisphaerales bacterium]
MHRPTRHAVVALIAGTCLVALTPSAQAWDAHGHRVITYLALDALPFTDKPAPPVAPPPAPPVAPGGAATPAAPPNLRTSPLPLWMTAPSFRDACAYQSAEPDRIRAQPTPSLVHLNGPDHYFDLDMLARWGMKVEDMPTLRHRFIKELSLARLTFPQNFTDYDEKKDAANEHEWPGLGPQAMMETYGHLQASFRTLKIIEFLGGEGRDLQIAQAQQNIIYHIGRLSHFVGDHAQPLHTTIHHHGWVRDVVKFPDPAPAANVWNPKDYTTDYGFHSYIDGTILIHHKITYESLTQQTDGTPVTPHAVKDTDPWKDILEHINRSYKEVEPLYQMHKDDTLRSAPGKQLIESRLRDGAKMLAALITAAWTSSDPIKRDTNYYINGTPPEGKPSLPEMGNRQIPARTATEHEKMKSESGEAEPRP